MGSSAGVNPWWKEKQIPLRQRFTNSVDTLRDATRDQIEDIWQVLYRGAFYRGGPVLMSAMAGIDQALWDIKGKRYGLSAHQLLGGKVRERIQVYSWVGG